MEFSELWGSIKETQTGKYEIDRNFEDKYLRALVENTNDFDLVWKVAGSHKAGDYNFEVKLENEFVKTVCPNEFDELWNFIAKTSSSDLYENDINLETSYDELLYDSAYSTTSLKRTLKCKYLICNEFEAQYKEAMTSVTDIEPEL